MSCEPTYPSPTNGVPLEVEVVSKHSRDEVQVKVRGELDVLTGPRLLDVLDDIDITPGGAVVLHVGDLTFVDSSGINAMLAVRRALSDRDGSLRLREVTPAVRRTLEIAGVDEYLGVN
jgi:anti-anti-sigma factor